jgi:hypothetical protein
MSIKRKLSALLATLTVVAPASTVATLSAGAATPACGPGCVSIFSKELGNYSAPGVVEAVLDGQASVGAPSVLEPASPSASSEDWMPLHPGAGLVSDFYAAGMVSAEANSHYGGERASQIEYAPFGIGTGLCVGLATVAYQNEGLTLQPCSVPALTVWILDFADSPATAPAYFPIVNASTTDFSRPFAMDLPQDEVASDRQILQIHVRRLQFLTDAKTLPDRQLWGAHFGAYTAGP